MVLSEFTKLRLVPNNGGKTLLGSRLHLDRHESFFRRIEFAAQAALLHRFKTHEKKAKPKSVEGQLLFP
jgi:hypothetical protein